MQERLDRPDAERGHRQPRDCARRGRGLDLRPPEAVGEAAREQDRERRVQAPKSERERTRRRGVEPLDVVDGEQQRFVGGQHRERASHGDTERARIDPIRGFLDEEGHLERTPPRRRKRWQDVIEDVLEQVAEAREREAAIGLGRSRFENAAAAPGRILHPRTPQGGLPDPCLALEDQDAGRRVLPV